MTGFEPRSDDFGSGHSANCTLILCVREVMGSNPALH